MLSIEHLSVGGNEGLLLDDISFLAGEKEKIGIIGFSGAGKTTLLRAILGILPPSLEIKQGKILYKGKDLLLLNRKRRRAIMGKSMALIPQNPMSAFDPRQTVEKQFRETLRVVKGLSREEQTAVIKESLEAVNLDVKKTMSSRPGELSGGQLSRVLIAFCLSGDAPLILADEPTSFLDQKNTGSVIQRMSEVFQDRTVLLTTHDPYVMEQFCQRILRVENGRLKEGKGFSQLIAQPESPEEERFSQAYLQEKKGEDWKWESWN